MKFIPYGVYGNYGYVADHATELDWVDCMYLNNIGKDTAYTDVRSKSISVSRYIKIF